ncbi:Hypothetical protein R9X50_00082600 [Acrodontium crateriforme]|uniref:Uncharacterized protein n=1 Tax=Acrodontium crateriforme TaxID=150365 RepID=A0AAQ3M0Z2_9PEZI|nr:Hypothetical protein R9X50_00082600 [Acrodontium crateriforme]
MRRVGTVLWPKLRVLQVYGANTGVGKTIFSSILCRAFQRRFPKVHYLKPVSTGPQDEADDHHLSSLTKNVQARCLYQFSEPVSPHIAARESPTPLTDANLVAAVSDELKSYANGSDGIAIVETAGGVLSPAPSGNSQADLYRPLRLPVVLIGDHQLGGIGTTISAWESLHIRGYDVKSVALFSEGRYDNHSYLKDYFAERDVHAISIPPPPERNPNILEDIKAMQEYYDSAANMEQVTTFTEDFVTGHDQRISALRTMPGEAHDVIWHPFMQHSERSKDNIVTMESAYGDFFQTYTTGQDPIRTPKLANGENAMLKPAFDGSASWWTQGLGHGNPKLALTAAHAAGRYGHVMFGGAVHEPALRLAQTIVSDMGNKRLAKVFYSDNGSTGMEVAVKMALRASAARNGWSYEDEVLILGLKGSYHGDTMGTMDCSEPSIYNKKVQWYTGRGHWIDFPQVKMQKGRWIVDVPDEFEGKLGERRSFDSLDAVFDFEGRAEDWKVYTNYCADMLSELERQGKKLGALVMEPILLGAGGMFFADPLFQRALVHTVRNRGTPPKNDTDWSGMPVVFDEVFTGLYRLGRFSAASFLQVDPDIVVNAKLLTGGLLPLCTTTASQSIFEAFLSNDKSDALLHGHSYTAHAMGCMVANHSLDIMKKLDSADDWAQFKHDWDASKTGQVTSVANGARGTWSMWSPDFVKDISHRANVDYVFALGSVLAISLKDPAGSGYASTAATGLRDKLLAGVNNQDEWVIHSRVLGNVLYLMAALSTNGETLGGVEDRVLKAI